MPLQGKGSSWLNVQLQKAAGLLCTAGAIILLSAAQTGADTVVRFETPLGRIDVQLYDDVTPVTVQNFLGYVIEGHYDQTIFHRLRPGFVLQGGGFGYDGDAVELPTGPPVVNEFQVSNTQGTIAMAKLGDDPDGATDQFFFNLADNSANLDYQNGGFTVFGEIVSGMDVLELLAGQQIWDRYNIHPAWNEIPLCEYTAGSDLADHLEWIHTINVMGDLDDDGFVDQQDIDDVVMANWGQNVTPGDLLAGDVSGDGFVGQADLDTVLDNWHSGLTTISSSSQAVVPEPATACLLVAGVCLSWLGKRR